MTDDNSQEAHIAWENMLRHPEIRRLKRDFKSGKYKVYFVYAGRRSFKTETAKRLLVDYALHHRNKNLLYCAPTERQASDIAWEDLKKMVPKLMIFEIKEAVYKIILKNGTKITLYSLDEPSRIEGQLIHGIVVDEAAMMKEGTWFKNISYAIGDREDSWAILISTPEGRHGEFFELWDKMIREPEHFENFGSYHWHRGELLGETWMAKTKHQVDARSFEQEQLGMFVSGQGLAYNAFNREKHLNDSLLFNPHLPLDICCDFNVSVMPWPLLQNTLTMTQVLDEVTGRDCSIEHMCRQLKERVAGFFRNDYFMAKNHQLRFFGDASGGYIRDPASHQAAWVMIRDAFLDWNAEFKLIRKNPHPGDRVAFVNSRLMTADGTVRTQVSSKAKELIADFESISYEDITKGEKTRVGELRSHASDAFGYCIYHLSLSDWRSSTGIRNIS